MPLPRLPTDLRKAVSSFTAEQRLLLKQPEMQQQMRVLGDFSRSLRLAGDVAPAEPAVAQNALDWMQRLPEPLLASDKAPLVDLNRLSLPDAHLALLDGLQVLALGAKALLGTAERQPKLAPQALVQVAFGNDAASLALRKPLLDRKAPGLPPLPGPDVRQLPGLDRLPDISRLVREGTLRELMRSFADCGHMAQAEADWVARVQPIGQVTRMKADRPCGGGTLVLAYAGFGAEPPAPDQVADILVALPTRSGCTHISLRKFDPGFFDPARWADQGKLALTLPDAVISGAVGFFSVPPPMAEAGPCVSGGLATAAGMLQAVLVKHAGAAYGAQFGQTIVDLAGRAEAGRHRPLPCATAQADKRNLLTAGPPFIDKFRVVETGPVHPRGTVTVEWSTFNAQTVEIVAVDAPDSENPHELPAIPGPLATMGRITLAVPCTRRWQAHLVLRASNPQGCGKQPLEAVVALRSGFSHYCLACAKADITDSRRGLGMAGFAYKRQTTSGLVQSPQSARAFVIEENSAAPDRQRLVLVVADIWTCTQIVKRTVIERINQRFNRPAGAPLLTEHNLLIAGTHTHAGPGGYSEYLLYNLTISGFDQGVFDTIVNGICDAIANAVARTQPGRLYATAADLPDVGANRSFAAYQRNPEYQAGGTGPADWTDREMLLLRFMQDGQASDKPRPIGALNWHALHPTSLGQFNTQISGDSKGHAALRLEAELAAAAGPLGFVAAFGNGSAGDVSGNLELDDQGRATTFKPLGGELPMLGVLPPMPLVSPPVGGVVPPLLRAPDAWERDLKRMQMLGDRQFAHALMLFRQAGTELTGPLDAQQIHIDMAGGVPISGRPGARTWPAALGVSFGAGSSEDSIAYASTGPLDIDAAIIEGMTRANFTAGGIQAWTLGILQLGPQAIPIAASLATGVVPVGAALGVLLHAIAMMAALPLARSYFFASLAPLLLPGETDPQRPVRPGLETAWDIPLPGSLDPALVAGHGDKPIMFAVGLAQLRSRPLDGSGGWSSQPCPLVPNVVPLQLLRIGSLALAAVPAEFTATAGRRLKAGLHQAFGGKLSHVAVSNYSNGYSGYVATEEEYGAQHYEGASTLYGPHTLAAYLQTFDWLALRLQGGNSGVPGASPGFVAPAIFRKP